MTESEYKTVVKLMIEKLEQCRDEIAEQQAEVERLEKELDRLSQVNLYHRADVSAQNSGNEVVKALECCLVEECERGCYSCPLNKQLRCRKILFEHIAGIIKEKETVGDSNGGKQ